ILAIAREEFLREGYSGASVSRIAALVGGSKATLYSYFPSKKALFIATAEAEAARCLDQLFEVVLEHDVEATLAKLGRRFQEMLVSDENIAFNRLVVAEAARFPELGMATYRAGVRPGLKRIAAYLERAMKEGVLREADGMAAAELLLDLGMGQLHKLKLWNVIPAPTEQAIETAVESMLNVFFAVYGNDALAARARSIVVPAAEGAVPAA
ncbi:MAG: TetR/AcrR family transcriptional regulator, partial [Alphaproteobacteria bacterium]|nr:TetR/AcrR family transcriptional regulator [Alphaproteobacteria bacterium]